MFPSLSLVLVSLAVVFTRSMVHAGELCEQDPSWRTSVYDYVQNCATANKNLFDFVLLVRNYTDKVDDVFNLREPQTVASIEDFYLELAKYSNILHGFYWSMKAYMATPEYANESTVLEVANFTNTYLTVITKSLTEIGQTMVHMSKKINQADPRVTTTTAPTKNLEDIYAETYFVTSKMSTLLLIWEQKCRSCISAKRRRAVKEN